MRKHRKSLWARPVLSTAAAVCCGLACTAAAAVLSAVIVYYVMKDMGLISAFSGFSLGAGACTGAYIYGKYRRRKGLLGGTLCGVLMYAVIAAAGIIVLGEPAGIKKLLLLAFCGGAGGVAGVNSKRPKDLMDQ
ncbi:TIGR04086 family membrane protein [uncultured Ruminococcus sp.]|uniref:TIGR04086 family membrane protein n=1 Tax=uncultured Ruminococcus sp. TaxID=165186 RepID=UPI002603BEF1|nr:TIGR04086 family membrane protein [uncultured Ruminococcus sp.]